MQKLIAIALILCTLFLLCSCFGENTPNGTYVNEDGTARIEIEENVFALYYGDAEFPSLGSFTLVEDTINIEWAWGDTDTFQYNAKTDTITYKSDVFNKVK